MASRPKDAAAPAAPAATDAECNRIFKVKAEADKMISSQQLASDLNLPLETVNASQLRLGGVPLTQAGQAVNAGFTPLAVVCSAPDRRRCRRLLRFLPRRPPGILLVVDGIRC